MTQIVSALNFGRYAAMALLNSFAREAAYIAAPSGFLTVRQTENIMRSISFEADGQRKSIRIDNRYYPRSRYRPHIGKKQISRAAHYRKQMQVPAP